MKLNKLISILKYLLNTKQPLINDFPQIDRRRQYFVGFDIPSGDATVYPQVIMPKKGTLIKLPTKGRGKNTKKGPGEGYLCWQVLRHHLKGFYDNVAVSVGGHRYVPDLAYIDEEHGIFIDIENDEPYVMSSRIPTHYTGKDDDRNRAFTEAGWIVVRFSERQDFNNAAGSLKFVYDLIKKINPTSSLPSCLQNIRPVELESRWSYDHARQLAAADYRMTYMGKKIEWWLYNRFLR